MKNVVIAVLCLLAAAGIFLGGRAVALHMEETSPPPPACVANGGEWHILHWSCWPPLPGPPPAPQKAGWA